MIKTVYQDCDGRVHTLGRGAEGKGGYQDTGNSNSDHERSRYKYSRCEGGRRKQNCGNSLPVSRIPLLEVIPTSIATRLVPRLLLVEEIAW